ncbi:MAG: transcription termination/antitermination protein NusG [Holosporales bacterium]|jgi:transcriptional antiterminator NusG|nr:transcription termination/antitermination protein NusG [Holosporales bacterium]
METPAAKWYVISVYSGLENSVVQAIKAQAMKNGMLDVFEDFFVPSEQVIESRKGSKVTVNKNFFPGYILVKVCMSDEIWSLICSVPRVNGFLGAKRPLPVPESEISKIFAQVKESKEKPINFIVFEIGEVVKVCDGPFASFTGVVEGIDNENQRLTLSITIFGRPTPIELEFDQVEKN